MKVSGDKERGLSNSKRMEGKRKWNDDVTGSGSVQRERAQER